MPLFFLFISTLLVIASLFANTNPSRAQCFPIDIAASALDDQPVLAAHGRYIAVGIPRKSTVLLLQLARDSLTVLHAFERPDVPGFGRALAFSSDELLIGSGTKNDLAAGGFLYIAPLTTPSALRPLFSHEPGTLHGFSLSSHGGRIALSNVHQADDGLLSFSYFFYEDSALTPFSLPSPLDDTTLAGDLALYEDTLLVGAPLDTGAWIIDLSAEHEPVWFVDQMARDNEMEHTGTAVALTGALAAVSAKEHAFGRRTVVNAVDGITETLPIGGRLAARGNLLAVSDSPGVFNEMVPRIALFRITPHAVMPLDVRYGYASVFAGPGFLTLRPATHHLHSMLCVHRL